MPYRMMASYRSNHHKVVCDKYPLGSWMAHLVPKASRALVQHVLIGSRAHVYNSGTEGIEDSAALSIFHLAH